MLKLQPTLREYLGRCCDVLALIDPAQVEGLAADIHAACEERRFVFLCGNGGSGANASHFCEDLGKSTLEPEELDREDVKRLKALSLTDNTPYILAWANDEGFERVFVEQLRNLASPGDLLIAISGSGNSPNILSAVGWANEHRLNTWGVTGFDGGRLMALARSRLHVPVNDMGLVESIHLLLFHWVLGEVRARLHRPEGRRQQRPAHAG